VLGDRLMFRMNYRNFGNLRLGAREPHRPGRWPHGPPLVRAAHPEGRPSVYQQRTYAPTDGTANPLWRWMGSVAQDKKGDIAAGYSASGPNDFPSVRYTGPAAGDPLGQMTQAAQVAYTGTGPQTEVEGRWGVEWRPTIPLAARDSGES
jgi:hypothetical protein